MKRIWTGLGIVVCMVIVFNLLLAISIKARSQQVDLLLMLGFDVSQSVDPQEYNLQIHSYADALLDTRVQRLLLSQTSAILVYEWAVGQSLVINCQIIRDASHLLEISNTIRTHSRNYNIGQMTAIGNAIVFAVNSLNECPVADRIVLDISGDGISNEGVEINFARDMAASHDITINTMPILDPISTDPYDGSNRNEGLVAYFRNHVQLGYHSFTMVANSFEDIREMLVKKLVMEVSQLYYR